MDVGCYCVNVSRMLAGAEPLEAQAWAVWGPTGVDLQLAGMLRFPGEVMAHFDCALTLERRESYEAAGTEASLQVPAAFLPGKETAAFREDRGREPARLHEVAGADEYQLMVEHFADCVLTGQPVRYPVSEAVANLRAIEALYRSARTATPTRVPW